MAKDVIDGVLAVGRVLSPSLVAHGIETREQVDFLRSKAFDQVQGFYFGRPVRAAEVWEALRAEDVELAGTEQAL